MVGFITIFTSFKANTLFPSSPIACTQDRPHAPLPSLYLYSRDCLQFHTKTSSLQPRPPQVAFFHLTSIYSVSTMCKIFLAMEWKARVKYNTIINSYCTLAMHQALAKLLQTLQLIFRTTLETRFRLFQMVTLNPATCWNHLWSFDTGSHPLQFLVSLIKGMAWA